MQLRLIRFDLLVPLFLTFIPAEAPKGFSHVAATLTPNPMEMSYRRVSPPSRNQEDKSSAISYHRNGSGPGSGSPEVDDLGQKDRDDKWTQRRLGAGTGIDGKSSVKSTFFNRIYSPNLLAEKMAQEALGSKEMQDTIKNLASLKGGRKQQPEFSNEPSKVSRPSTVSQKKAERDHDRIPTGDDDHRKHKARGNRTHKKKHKNRGRKHRRKGRSKRNRSEKGSSKTRREKKTSKSVRRGKRIGSKGRQSQKPEKSVARRIENTDDEEEPKTLNKVEKNLTRSTNNTDENLIGEKLPSRESGDDGADKGASDSLRDQNNRDSYKGNGIIAKLMRTTTRDPNKKHPGDQGVEYSEYYSENENENENFLATELTADDSVPGGIRSVREIVGDDSLPRYNYRDLSDDQMLEGDIDRRKRSGHRSVQVVQEPLNSVEYVDSSEGPVQANGIIGNGSEMIAPRYFAGYDNYIPERNERSKNAESWPLADPNANPSTTNADDRLLDNAPSQLPRPQLAGNGNSPFYSSSASGIPPRRSASSASTSAALPSSTASTRRPSKTSGNIVVGTPEDAKLFKTSSAVSVLASSSHPSLASALSSPAGLRDVRPEENFRSRERIEAVVSRETATQITAAKNGKTNGNCSGNSNLKPGDYSRPGNATLMPNETKAVASEILSEIIGELEELKFENPKDELKEGLPCRLTGSWVTSRAGVRIDMKVTNHSVLVNLDYLAPPITTEGLLNVTWNVTGFAPFKRGGPFTLMATNNRTKTLAVFVGACKVCQGIDTIEGSWTVSREPRDCRDFQMSTSIFNEIFRRTRLVSAIKDKQMKHEAQLSSTSITSGGNSSSSSEVPNIAQEEPINFGKAHNQTS